MQNKKLLSSGAIILGILFVLLSVYYFITPANNLAHFMPGYAAGATKVHFKHGLGLIILALGCFAFAWFSTGKKKSTAIPSAEPKENGQ